MSTISLYDPGLSAFASVSAVNAASPSPASQAQLLLNILIELRVQTKYLADESSMPDDPQSLRNDVVSHGSYI